MNTPPLIEISFPFSATELRGLPEGFRPLAQLSSDGIRQRLEKRWRNIQSPALKRFCQAPRIWPNVISFRNNVHRKASNIHPIGARMEKVVELMLQRGMVASRDGRPADAVRAYADVIARADATSRQVGIAHFNRGVLRLRLEDFDGAAEDFGALVDTPGAPRWLLCRARLLRGELRWNFRRDARGAIDDLSAVVADAQTLGTTQAAAADSRVLVTQQNSPLELAATARTICAEARWHLGDEQEAVEDAVAVIGTEGISPETRSAAYATLAEFLLLLGRVSEAQDAAKHAKKLSPRSSTARFLEGLAACWLGDGATGSKLCIEAIGDLRHPQTVKLYQDLIDRFETRRGNFPWASELRARLKATGESLESESAKRLATKVRRLNLGR